MKKISVQVIPALPRNSGSFIRAYYFAKGLKKASCSVELIKPLEKSLPLKLDFIISLFFYSFKIITSRADFLISVKSYPNCGIPLIIRKIMGGKIIIDTDDLAFAYSKGLFSKISKISQEIILPFADLYTYHSPALFDYLLRNKKIPAGKIFKLPQAVNLQIFKPKTSNKQNFLKKFKLKNNRLLTFVGHFDIACDLEFILKALAKCIKKENDLKLVLVGDGDRLEEYRNLAIKLGINQQIIWTGVLDQEKVAEIIRLSEICLVYYRPKLVNKYRESLKLREYLAMNKMILANDFADLNHYQKCIYQSKSNLNSYSLLCQKLLKSGGDGREKQGREAVLELDYQKICKKLAQKLIELKFSRSY